MVRIPAEVAGAVIGRGGENIKEIQRKTMTKIDFKDGEIIGWFSSFIFDGILVQAIIDLWLCSQILNVPN